MKTLLFWLAVITFLLISLTSTSQNSNPVAVDDFYVVDEDDVIVMPLLSNDYDPDGDPIEVYKIRNFDYTIFSNGYTLINDTMIVIPPEHAYGKFEFDYWVVEKGSKSSLDTGHVVMKINKVASDNSDSLTANNISALFNASGELFWDYWNAHFRVPKGGNPSAIFDANLWIGGFDEDSNLYTAAQTYRQQQSMDFYYGPVGEQRDSVYEKRYDKVWKLNRNDLDDFFTNRTGAASWDKIMNWPVHGNTANKESEYLAPFIDLDMDSSFDPYKGEYPCIRGDEAVYFMINDDSIHTETEGNKFGIEVLAMAYAFEDPSDTPLYNTIFLNYKIRNRSKKNFRNVYLGLWTEFNLGYPYDDYLACDTNLHSFICYNADNFDSGGYGTNPPAVGVVFLNKSMDKFMYYNNDWSYIGNPSEAVHFYYYLSGRFKNKQHLRYGGDGFNNVWENREVNYAFSGHPKDPYPAWTEYTAGNTPYPKRALGSHGPFDLDSNETYEVDLAFVWARDKQKDHLENYDLLLDYIRKIRNWYANNPPGCYIPSITNVFDVHSSGIQVYPNPANDYINLLLSKDRDYKIALYDISGKLVKSFSVKSAESSFSVDVSGLSGGTYLLNVTSEFESNTYKVLKQ